MSLKRRRSGDSHRDAKGDDAKDDEEYLGSFHFKRSGSKWVLDVTMTTSALSKVGRDREAGIADFYHGSCQLQGDVGAGESAYWEKYKIQEITLKHSGCLVAKGLFVPDSLQRGCFCITAFARKQAFLCGPVDMAGKTAKFSMPGRIVTLARKKKIKQASSPQAQRNLADQVDCQGCLLPGGDLQLVKCPGYLRDVECSSGSFHPKLECVRKFKGQGYWVDRLSDLKSLHAAGDLICSHCLLDEQTDDVCSRCAQGGSITSCDGVCYREWHTRCNDRLAGLAEQDSFYCEQCAVARDVPSSECVRACVRECVSAY